MSIRACAAIAGILTVFCGSIATASAAVRCGPHEDSEKLSYRQLAGRDFAGERPREKGQARNTDSTSIVITTAVIVDELRIEVDAAAGGRVAARVSGLCVRAYFMKRLSGRKSERAVNWDSPTSTDTSI